MAELAAEVVGVVAADDMTPMEVESSRHDFDVSETFVKEKWLPWIHHKAVGSGGGGGEDDEKAGDEDAEQETLLPAKYRLIASGDDRKKSVRALQFAVLTAAISTKMLNPNYAIMVTPGLHPDSFDSTDPFDFNSATYFLPMMSLLGVAVASVFLGKLSDKSGRKKVLLLLSVISGFGNIVKYFTRATFWGFCITQLIFGFFLGNLPVAMAWVGDVFTSKKEKEKQLSQLVACFVLGNSGGGIIAILMQDSGLFTPLWVGAGLCFLSAIQTFFRLIEPGDVRLQPIGKNILQDEADEEHKVIERPEVIDNRVLWNIIGGAIADNFGSTALFPLCLSPLALDTYFIPFNDAGLEPIMSITGYQWLSVMVAALVVPSTFVTPFMFRKVGIAGTCVFGNFFTGLLTLALLLIATLPPATTASFAGFVFVMYAGFPVTVWSQLTTGPMLDIIAPTDMIGYVQGLNNSAMNFGMALAPWLFGLLADATTTDTAIWTGIGISWLAAAINTPLMWHKSFGREQKPPPPDKRPLPGEDKEAVTQALDGKLSDATLWLMNMKRLQKKEPMIIPRVSTYEEDRNNLSALLDLAGETFQNRKDLNQRVLLAMDDPENAQHLDEYVAMLNAAHYNGDPESIKTAKDDMGQWVADYLAANGYNPHINSVLIKQMVLTVFPSISGERDYTTENVKGRLLMADQVLDEYLTIEEKRKYSWSKLLGNGGAPIFYS
ncbi:MAG: hypothetical protein SGILL_000608 [Bacillariaceae sp.]